MEIAAGIIFVEIRTLLEICDRTDKEKDGQYMIVILCTAFSFAIKVFCYQRKWKNYILSYEIDRLSDFVTFALEKR